MPNGVNFKGLGSTGLRRYGPYIYEEFLPELRWPRAGRIYQEMADNDPVIGSILYLAEMLIRGTTWDVQAASLSAEDTEAAEFLTSCMEDMEMSWANVISEILSILTYGFSVHEIIYKVRRGPEETKAKYRSKYTDGRIGWRAIPIRSQTSIEEWVYSPDYELVAAVQRAEPDYNTIVLPMSKCLLFRTRVSRENPEGKSLLRNAYRPWFFKKHFEEIEGIGIERDLAGFPVLTAPEGLDLWNAEDATMVQLKANAEALVQSVRRDSEEGILLPNGWDLKLLTSGSSRQIDIGGTIDRYDNRMAITMLSDIILLGDKSGSFALADTKQSMLAASLQSQVCNIADVFNNKAVPQLFKYNAFNNLTELPKIVPGQIQTPTLKEVALLMRAMDLDIAGDQKLQNYFRHILGMPELSEKDFKDIYQVQAANTDTAPNNATTAGGDKDLTDRPFEQNDMNYTGGEM
jgi:hypothetical protein